MDIAIMYPKKCRKGIHRLVDEIGVGVETAYAMMLMTATLMDLNPEDEEVVHMILQDCGIEDSEIA
jgi:hypothetical protein